MLQAIIIDDELHCIEYLKDLLVQTPHYEIQVVGQAQNLSDAIALFNRIQPDIVFLDIHLTKSSGFDFLDSVDYAGSKIVFVTAYDQYAIKAFRYAAVNYLLKPVNIEELGAVLKKLGQNGYANLQSVNTFKNNDRLKKIALPVSNGLEIVELENICYFEADGSYSRIYLNDKKPLLICRPLSFFEDLLSSNRFLRIHRSMLVNGDKITGYNSHENTIVMESGTELSVSIRKRSEIIQFLRTITR